MLDEKILNVLRHNRDSYVSGEELCKMADISRAAIWKHIEKLREEGYDIEALPHLGYKLIAIPDSLIPLEIKWRLKTKVFGREVISYKKVDSTNIIAYELAKKGMKEGTVILADEQVKGRGRHGRHWASPGAGGIYMSCILRPSITPNEIPGITLLAAIAVAQAIRDISALEVTIKWPNDIMMDGKKLCGILTEMKAEQDRVDFVVLGIGINVNSPIKQLPRGASSIKEELRQLHRAGVKTALSRVELVKKVLERLEEYYNILKKEGFGPIIETWKDLSSMIGSRVKVTLPGKTFEGLAHDINPDGALVVRTESGLLEKVSSGDVVIVGIRG
ncbi:MAG: biotin--[acetyl-CoA-carboxylase] ligase [Candidatus Omnitrophota bacterium]|nr:biotin--[acetyl-CoA-carboxylase] ligase [Candidatus Omnitrophota bacterium]